jgi:hypothetical protein
MMENTSERNRLRYAGRVPKETLDYLAEKKREHNRFRWSDVPLLLLAFGFLCFMIAQFLRNEVPMDSRNLLLSFAAVVSLVLLITRRVQSLIA